MILFFNKYIYLLITKLISLRKKNQFGTTIKRKEKKRERGKRRKEKKEKKTEKNIVKTVQTKETKF